MLENEWWYRSVLWSVALACVISFRILEEIDVFLFGFFLVSSVKNSEFVLLKH